MRETLKKLRDALIPIYGKGESEAMIRIIFHHLKGWNTTDMVIHEPDELSPFVKQQIDEILSRLLRFEPIQYITGEARFHGMEFHVTPDVLIPRPETDELVDIIVNEAEDKADLRVLDLCTGSGCIAIALARSLRFPIVTAVDISDKAIEITKENAKSLKATINPIVADIFKWRPSGNFDIIVSNPPYIDESEKTGMEDNVLKYEPSEALFVPDSNPLVFYDRIGDVAKESLNPGGKLYLEINPRHANELIQMLKDKGFIDIESRLDSFGKERFIICRQPESY